MSNLLSSVTENKIDIVKPPGNCLFIIKTKIMNRVEGERNNRLKARNDRPSMSSLVKKKYAATVPVVVSFEFFECSIFQ